MVTDPIKGLGVVRFVERILNSTRNIVKRREKSRLIPLTQPALLDPPGREEDREGDRHTHTLTTLAAYTTTTTIITTHSTPYPC